jgi:CheY-like chemotaxis protein/nitrogen-specific signal transduction histidine kinase
LEAIAFVGLVAGGVQWRVRTLRKRNAQLEQKVEARTAELKEANAAKTQFVANMSHDIRNPLSGIVGLTLALEDTPLDAQQRELVSTLRECTSYLSTLVDDVLDFASIEAGKIELHPAPFVPAEVLNSVVTALKAQCAEKGAFVTIETDPDIPRLLLGDAGRVQQVLVNYLSNALKYGGGHIRVCAAVAADSAGEVEFAVADEGPGLSEADRAKLFTQFNRLEAARNSDVKGSGLGLAACRLLADAMGGAVGVDSEVGHGSRFFLRLPLVAAAEPVQVDDALALPPTTILLVEDTDYNAIATKAVLRKLGLTCDRAANGAEALALFAEKRHHIVLLDRNLPDMDGTEVAGRIRELETDGAHTMIFAVTAYCTAEDKQKCLDSGMDAFVGKPLTPEKIRRALLAAAEQVLSAGSPAAPEVVTAAAVTPSAEPALPTIDTSLLEYLAEGSAGGLGLQVDRYIDALRETHAELLRIRGEGDAMATGNAVHRVLGHARMINATEFTDLLNALESAARCGEFDKVDVMLPAVARHVDRLTAALRRHPGVLRA